MKRTLLSFFLVVITIVAIGQAQEGTVEFQKSQQPAAVLEVPYSPDIVNAALGDFLSKKGRSKATDFKGFTTYRNTQQVATDSVNADLYFRVERKSRKEKEVTVLSLLLNASKAPADRNTHFMDMEQAKIFLNELVPTIEAYALELQIKEQNEAVAKAESKYKNLTNEGSDLEKRRENIVKQIEDNKADQQKQMNEIENQKKKLAEAVALRKS